MGWMMVARRSRRVRPVDEDDNTEALVKGFACEPEIRMFAVCCPGCGAAYDIKARDLRSRVFNRRTQRFRCSRCRLSARVRVAIDVVAKADASEQPSDRR